MLSVLKYILLILYGIILLKKRQLVNDEFWNENILQEAKKQLNLIDNFFLF